jgi:hypothetical protein
VFFLRSQRLPRLKASVHKGPLLKFLSNGGLGISVVEAPVPVTGHLVRGITSKIGCGDERWTELAQDRVRWQV